MVGSMALKAKISKDDFDKLPEVLQEHYKAKDGAYVLEAEGLVDRTALEAERTARSTAAREFQELKDKIGDLDPDKARAALARVQEMADKQLLDQGKVDELIESRTDAMRKDHANQLKAFETKIADRDTNIGALTATLKKLRINSDLTPLALKKGVRPEALDDVIARMTITGVDGIRWDVDGDNVVAKVGDQVKYGKDPQRSMDFEEGLDLLASKAPHLFGESQGGGAQGDRGGRGSSQRVITNADASDPAKYRAARDEAKKAGVQLVVE